MSARSVSPSPSSRSNRSRWCGSARRLRSGCSITPSFLRSATAFTFFSVHRTRPARAPRLSLLTPLPSLLMWIAVLTGALPLLSHARPTPPSPICHPDTSPELMKMRHTGPFVDRFQDDSIQDDDERATAARRQMLSYLTTRMDEMARVRWAYYEGPVRECLAQLAGEQYTYIDYATRKMVRVPVDKARQRVARDIQIDNLVQFASQLERFTGRVKILPVSDTNAQSFVSAKAQQFTDALLDRMNISGIRGQMFFALYLGWGALIDGYDVNEGSHIEVPKYRDDGTPELDEAGNPVIAYTGAEGLPFFAVETLLNVLVPTNWAPGMPLREAFHARTMTPDEFAARYGEECLEKTPTTEGEVAGSQFGARPDFMRSSTEDKTYRVYFYWLRADATNDFRGALVEFTREKILAVNDNPYQHGEVPISPFRWAPSVYPYSLGPGPLTIAAQRLMHDADFARLRSLWQQAAPTLLNPVNSQIDNEDLASYSPGKVITIGNPYAIPQYLSAPPYPAQVDQAVAEFTTYARGVSRTTDEARGQLPGKAPIAGKAMFAMAEMQRVGLSFPLGELFGALEKGIRRNLHNVRQFFMEGREITVVGEANEVARVMFEQAFLPGEIHVRVAPADLLQGSRMASIEVLMQLYAMGAIVDPTGQPNPEKLLELIGSQDLGPSAAARQRAQLYAQKENERMLAGEMVEPVNFQNHRIHIEEHLRMFEEERVAENPQVRAAFKAHIKAHQALWKQDRIDAETSLVGAKAISEVVAQGEAQLAAIQMQQMMAAAQPPQTPMAPAAPQGAPMNSPAMMPESQPGVEMLA